MKHLAALIFVLGFAAVAFCQDAELITIPTPKVVLVTQPVNLTLSAAQVKALVTALDGAGVKLPPNIAAININIIASGADAGSANVALRFR